MTKTYFKNRTCITYLDKLTSKLRTGAKFISISSRTPGTAIAKECKSSEPPYRAGNFRPSPTPSSWLFRFAFRFVYQFSKMCGLNLAQQRRPSLLTTSDRLLCWVFCFFVDCQFLRLAFLLSANVLHNFFNFFSYNGVWCHLVTTSAICIVSWRQKPYISGQI